MRRARSMPSRFAAAIWDRPGLAPITVITEYCVGLMSTAASVDEILEDRAGSGGRRSQHVGQRIEADRIVGASPRRRSWAGSLPAHGNSRSRVDGMAGQMCLRRCRRCSAPPREKIVVDDSNCASQHYGTDGPVPAAGPEETMTMAAVSGDDPRACCDSCHRRRAPRRRLDQTREIDDTAEARCRRCVGGLGWNIGHDTAADRIFLGESAPARRHERP